MDPSNMFSWDLHGARVDGVSRVPAVGIPSAPPHAAAGGLPLPGPRFAALQAGRHVPIPDPAPCDTVGEGLLPVLPDRYRQPLTAGGGRGSEADARVLLVQDSLAAGAACGGRVFEMGQASGRGAPGLAPRLPSSSAPGVPLGSSSLTSSPSAGPRHPVSSGGLMGRVAEAHSRLGSQGGGDAGGLGARDPVAQLLARRAQFWPSALAAGGAGELPRGPSISLMQTGTPRELSVSPLRSQFWPSPSGRDGVDRPPQVPLPMVLDGAERQMLPWKTGLEGMSRRLSQRARLELAASLAGTVLPESSLETLSPSLLASSSLSDPTQLNEQNARQLALNRLQLQQAVSRRFKPGAFGRHSLSTSGLSDPGQARPSTLSPLMPAVTLGDPAGMSAGGPLRIAASQGEATGEDSHEYPATGRLPAQLHPVPVGSQNSDNTALGRPRDSAASTHGLAASAADARSPANPLQQAFVQHFQKVLQPGQKGLCAGKPSVEAPLASAGSENEQQIKVPGASAAEGLGQTAAEHAMWQKRQACEVGGAVQSGPAVVEEVEWHGSRAVKRLRRDPAGPLDGVPSDGLLGPSGAPAGGRLMSLGSGFSMGHSMSADESAAAQGTLLDGGVRFAESVGALTADVLSARTFRPGPDEDPMASAGGPCGVPPSLPPAQLAMNPAGLTVLDPGGLLRQGMQGDLQPFDAGQDSASQRRLEEPGCQPLCEQAVQAAAVWHSELRDGDDLARLEGSQGPAELCGDWQDPSGSGAGGSLEKEEDPRAALKLMRRKSRVEKERRSRIGTALSRLRSVVRGHGDMASVLIQAADVISSQQVLIAQLEAQVQSSQASLSLPSSGPQ